MALAARLGGLAAAFLAAACAGPAASRAKPGFVPPGLLAVLPPHNFSVDLDAPDVVRPWLADRLVKKKGYRVLPLDQVDLALKGLGVSDGGQLGALAPAELGKALGADALVYCDITEFQHATTGFLNVKKVHLKLRMLDARTGEELWAGEGHGANSTTAVSGGAALREGLKELGTRWAEKATRTVLLSETLDAIWDAVQFLPRGR